MNSISERIKSIREEKNFSRKKLAEIAGVSQPTIYNIENGKTDNVTLQVGKNIAAALGIPFGELFEIENAPSDTTKVQKRIDELEEKLFKLNQDLNQRNSHIATLVQYKDILKHTLIRVIIEDSYAMLYLYAKGFKEAETEVKREYYEEKIEYELSNRDNKLQKLLKAGFITQEDIDNSHELLKDIWDYPLK